MVVAGSLSKTEANAAAGAKTQLADLVNAVIVVLALLFLAALFSNLPLATLAAVVIRALWRAGDPRRLRAFLKVNRVDFGLGLITLITVLLLDTLPAVIIGVVMSLLVLIYRVSYPHTAELGLDPSTGSFEDLALHDQAAPVPGVVVYRFDAPLEYSDAKTFFDDALGAVAAADPPPHTLVLDGEVFGDIDSTGIETLADLAQRMRGLDIDLVLCRFHVAVIDTMTRSDALSDVTSRRSPADPPKPCVSPSRSTIGAERRREKSGPV